jgi:hypothetical protein
MKKNIIAGVVGGIILWVWGFLAWVVLPLHTTTMPNVPNEDVVMEVLKNNLPSEAVYVFPGMPTDMSHASKAAYEEKYKRGPRGMIIYNPKGDEPMMASEMISGLIIFMISAYLAAWLLSRSTAITASFFSRVVFCGLLGVLMSFYGHLSAWNWMGFPFNYTTAQIADAIIGWLLAGLGIAAIVKPPTSDQSSQ